MSWLWDDYIIYCYFGHLTNLLMILIFNRTCSHQRVLFMSKRKLRKTSCAEPKLNNVCFLDLKIEPLDIATICFKYGWKSENMII